MSTKKLSFWITTLTMLLLFMQVKIATALSCTDYLFLYFVECHKHSCAEGFVIEDRHFAAGSGCDRLPYVADVTEGEMREVTTQGFKLTSRAITTGTFQVQIWTQCVNTLRQEPIRLDQCDNRVYVDQLSSGNQQTLASIRQQQEKKTSRARMQFNATVGFSMGALVVLGIFLPLAATLLGPMRHRKDYWVIASALIVLQIAGSVYLLNLAYSLNWFFLSLLGTLILCAVCIEIIIIAWQEYMWHQR